jgi:hypothetical protein
VFLTAASAWATWSRVSTLPWPAFRSARICWDQGSYIYYLRSGAYDLWRYNINTGGWTPLANVPGGPSLTFPDTGCCICYTPNDGTNDNIFLLKGNGTDEFWRYNVAANTWSALPNIPSGSAPVGKGGALCYGGVHLIGSLPYQYIYAVKGHAQPDFYLYRHPVIYTQGQPLTGSWVSLAPLPYGGFYKGSALAYAGYPPYSGGYGTFAFRGSDGPWKTYRYSPPANMWEAPLGTTPYAVDDGAAMATAKINGLNPNSGDTAILCFHGHNDCEWWKYRTPSDRYDLLGNTPEPQKPGSSLTAKRQADRYVGYAEFGYPSSDNGLWRYEILDVPDGGGGQSGQVSAAPAQPCRVTSSGRNVTFSWYQAERAPVSLQVFDAAGRSSGTPVANRQLESGEYTQTWHHSGLHSQVLFYRLTIGRTAESGKLVLTE